MRFLLFIIAISFSAIFMTWDLTAQQNLSIRLLDRKSNEPLVGVHYIYADQKGVSDTDGRIKIRFEKDAELIFSHVNYGNWRLTEDEVADALKQGTIFREEKPHLLQPVTVIAMHHTSADKEILGFNSKERLSHDAGSILHRLPSINSIKKSGNYGFDPVIRGFKYDQLNIVIDGAQCATAACPNRMDPPTSQIAPNMMERVEIFKGPHSLRYGSSFGGTVNFISESPKFSEEIRTYGRLAGRSESNGNILRTEGLFGMNGSRYDIGFYGSFSNGDDYSDGDGEEIPARFQRASVGVNMGFKLTDNQELRFSATGNIADNTDFPSLPMDLISDKTLLFNFQHQMNFNFKKLTNIRTVIYGTFVDHLMDNLDKDINPRKVNAKTDANTQSIGGRSEMTWNFGGNRFYTGADLRIEKADGIRSRKMLMGPSAGLILEDNVWNGGQISKTGIFGEYHYNLYDDLNLILSGRLEYNYAFSTDLSELFYEKNKDVKSNELNPGISIGGLYKLSDEITLGLWFGRAQRSGSLTEKFINSFPVGLDPYELLGNPQLKAEVNNQADFTIKYQSLNTIVDIGLFASLINNHISSEIDPLLSPVMPSSPGVRRFKNIENALKSGFEINWKQELFLNFRHSLNLAYTFGRDESLNEPLPEIAPFDLRYSLLGSFFDEKIEPEIFLRHVLKQKRVSTTFGETETPSFSIIDFNLRYFYNKTISLAFGIQNILDETYYEHLSRTIKDKERAIYAPGRNLYLSLDINFM